MKKLILVFSLVLCLSAVIPAAARGKKNVGEARIRFTEKMHNFGTIKEKGGAVTARFEFVNEGDGNLVIIDVTTQCGCTRPKYPKKPIAPGKKGVIEVSFLPSRPESFNKKVTVKTNGSPRKTVLNIKGVVVPGK